ncbi:MAG TPA: S4 domain-containing protein, partial [Candidatus Paceibacterota bacterium]|nr:S4 domain-containing protein [Candidatus Paceibacterota bacterium]
MKSKKNLPRKPEKKRPSHAKASEQAPSAVVYPLRINRYLYLKNYCSRRQADRYIAEGLVKINGRLAVLGDRVEKTDRVEVDQSVQKAKEEYAYLAYYKPRGVVSHNP